MLTVAVGKCIGCHGGDLEGGMGGTAPALAGTSLSKDEIVKIIKEGQGTMPCQCKRYSCRTCGSNGRVYFIT